MVEQKAHDTKSPRSPWDSLYTGEAGDYEEPDADILEAGADLDVGEALDVGCGAGGLCIELDRRGWAVTGIDIASKAITAAQRAAEERGSDATFVVADAAAWQPERSYDLVTCNFGLPPQPDSRTAVYAMMRRAVAPGGVVLLKVGDHSDSQAPPAFVGYESLNLEELKRGFDGFEVLKAKIVDSPAHAHGHGGSKQPRELWKALLFMVRRPTP